MTDQKHCAATNKQGKPCRAAATETGFCYIHSSPARAAELGRQGGRGNRHFVPSALPPLPPLDSSEGVRKTIELIITEAYAGNQNAKRMLAFGPLLATLGKVIKTAELEERLKNVEAMFAAQQHGSQQGTQETEPSSEGMGADSGEDENDEGD